MRFLLQLIGYIVVLGGSAVALFTLVPGIAAYLPLHGSPPALFNSDSFLAINDVLKTAGSENLTHANRGQVLLALSRSLTGTLVIMLPITQVYMAVHPGSYHRTMVTALMILPICACAIVLLIQDSLALAFGLAALVAAVRFRIRLRDPLDGVYIFSAISVGLATGVGHLGVGYVMMVFFCLSSYVLWWLGFGVPSAVPNDEQIQLSAAPADSKLKR